MVVGLEIIRARNVMESSKTKNAWSNAEDYQRSLRLMLDLDADILCEGHYGVFR
jgi:hypothetical protein